MAIPSIRSGWLVDCPVNLAKSAEIAISELIWLKFDMEVANGHGYMFWLF
jgi:hypothetical protein